jgi:hypothetical protein
MRIHPDGALARYRAVAIMRALALAVAASSRRSGAGKAVCCASVPPAAKDDHRVRRVSVWRMPRAALRLFIAAIAALQR